MHQSLGPIIILEDDLDDQEILREVLEELKVPYRIDFYTQAKDVLEYLYTTPEKPFIIFSDVNLPSMNGLELRRIINEDDYLRQKSIPFVFLSTSADEFAVKEAYNLTVQGYFVKQHSIPDIKATVKLVIEYWERCKHVGSY
jgi:CheY-like chemotaxis protein